MTTAPIMLAASVAYFAVTIPLAMWIGRAIKRGQRR